jgi:hypothetical protein
VLVWLWGGCVLTLTELLFRYGSVRRSVVLSSSARYGVIRLGNALRGPARFGSVRSCYARYGDILAWLGLARSSPARLSKAWHGLIDVLRGMTLYGTVLSCPVRHSKALYCKVLSWCGGAGSGPAGSCRVWLCKARHFLARSAADVRGTVERSFAWHGELPFWRGIVLYREVLHRVVKSCPAKHCKALRAKALLWLGEVLFCVLGIGGVLYGMAKRAGALLGMVKCGTVGSGFARLRAVGRALVLLRLATAGRGFARLCRARFCLVLSRPGVEEQGSVVRGAATCSTAKCSLASLRRGQVWLGTVLQCNVLHGDLRRYFGMALRSWVIRCVARSGMVMVTVMRNEK